MASGQDRCCVALLNLVRVRVSEIGVCVCPALVLGACTGLVSEFIIADPVLPEVVSVLAAGGGCWG